MQIERLEKEYEEADKHARELEEQARKARCGSYSQVLLPSPIRKGLACYYPCCSCPQFALLPRHYRSIRQGTVSEIPRRKGVWTMVALVG